MRFPIFQLSWYHKEDSVGLVFASELPYEPQNFGFFAPIITPKHLIQQKRNQYNFMRLYDYYFPCEIEGEYVELKGELDYIQGEPILNFVVGKADYFSFKSTNPTENEKDIYSSLKYIGSERRYNFGKLSFLEFYPSDINLLNDFFTKKQGIFVGYTNHFGRYLANNISGG